MEYYGIDGIKHRLQLYRHPYQIELITEQLINEPTSDLTFEPHHVRLISLTGLYSSKPSPILANKLQTININYQSEPIGGPTAGATRL